MNCPFCELPEIKEREIIRNQYAWAFPTNIPIVPGHLLICPIRCIRTVNELTPDELNSILQIQFKMKAVLKKVFGAEGFNYAWNEEKIAGQSTPHLHFHMLPRKQDDVGVWDYEPRKFLYRPGSREGTPEQELKAIAELIKKEL